MAQLCRDDRLTSQPIGNRQRQVLAAAPQIVEKGNVDGAEQARITEPKRMGGR
ncbi:hypothetical protein [Chloroflexus sp.]|uniref:hypothetical protein n=1 Tax=Chloroflexus sp. TaxID=1904827 RepID=UPI00404AFB3C